MTATPNVLLVASLDTKQLEAEFTKTELESQGISVFKLDPSILGSVDPEAEVTPEMIAAALGKTMSEVRAIVHEGKCLALMIEGAIQCAHAVDERVGLSGIIGLGGSMGTTLATAVMRTFPVGLPKVMVSTMASGFTLPFVGFKDIVMVNSIADIAGLNAITRAVLRNGAMALAGMARAYRPMENSERPLVAMSTLGTTERCAVRVRRALEGKGFEVVIFHTLGTGGAAMDQMVRECDVAVVVDLSLKEVCDFVNGGITGAGPDRCKAALEKGVPTIFAPGNIDFVGAGPLEDAKARFPGKRYHIHNESLVAVRAEQPELEKVTRHMANLIGRAMGPVEFFVPLHGFSAHDSPGGHLYDPSLPPIFAEDLRSVMPKGVPIIELPFHINDEEFADAIIERVLALHARRNS